ncbi:MAG: ABC transporter ATP-binding protein, partial [Thermomicrobiales bacterium]
KEYGKSVVALQGLDLDIGDGEFFVLLGPSGAGKTTTLKCIAGLEQPTAGHVEIGGRDMSDIEPNARKVAMAFENYALYPQETVYDNIAFPLRSKRYYREPGEAQGIIERVTTTLGINHLLQRLPRELSGGQKQRVALARVLVRPADVLLLDEPLSHLDAKLRAAMRAELKSLGELQSTTSLYVTHDYLEALALGDRIAVLSDGELLQVGTREQIWHQPVNTFVAQAFGQPRINLISGEVQAGSSGARFRAASGGVDLPLDGFDVVPGTKVQAGLRPRDLVIGAQSGMAHIAGSVWISEPLGRQHEVTVDIGGEQVAVITPHGGMAIGENVTISAPVSRILLFDAETGARIPARNDGASAGRPIPAMEVSRG